MMTRRDDESIASTIKRETNLREMKRQLWVGIRQVSEFRKLTEVEAEIHFLLAQDHQIQELLDRSK
jgi:hypothetical protein